MNYDAYHMWCEIIAMIDESDTHYQTVLWPSVRQELFSMLGSINPETLSSQQKELYRNLLKDLADAR